MERKVLFSQALSCRKTEERAAQLYAGFILNHPEINPDSLEMEVEVSEDEEDAYGHGGGVSRTMIIYQNKETEKKEEVALKIPEGYEFDKVEDRVVRLKRVDVKWRDDVGKMLGGYYINTQSNIESIAMVHNYKTSYNVFATEKQAKSALAMARISQIMEHDKRFGGPVTDEEWKDYKMSKYIIFRGNNLEDLDTYSDVYFFLAFHTKEQRDLFIQENEDLVKDYLMLD